VVGDRVVCYYDNGKRMTGVITATGVGRRYQQIASFKGDTCICCGHTFRSFTLISAEWFVHEDEDEGIDED